MIRAVPMIALLACALFKAAAAENDNEQRARNRAVVMAEFAANTAAYSDNADMLVLPGLLANRKAGRITIRGEATGLMGNTTVEFFIIDEHSAHDYEAIAFSLATPGDIRKALVFIGLDPGRPPDHGRMLLWPKGERVIVTISDGESDPVRIERFVVDASTETALPETGLVFTGSRFIRMHESDEEALAADARDPRSVASNYNEPDSLLDVPRIAFQTDVYGRQMANPDHTLPERQLLEITMTPEYTDGRRRVLDILVSPGSANSIDEVAFSVRVSEPETDTRDYKLDSMLAEFVQMVKQGHDPFVTLKFANDLPLSVVSEICSVLGSIEGENGIRLEGPLPGSLFYKAFIPPAGFLDRRRRFAQPWELEIIRDDESGWSGVLTSIEEIWKDAGHRPELRPERHPVASPEELRSKLDELGPGLQVILIFADPKMTYGELMGFISQAMTTHDTIHVFLQDPPPFAIEEEGGLLSE